MSTDDTLDLLAPIPLPARAAIGRGAAAVLGVAVLVGGLVARLPADRADDPHVPLAAVLGAIALVVLSCAVISLAPWRRWLSPRGQELLLGLFVAIPAISLVVLYASDDPLDTDALTFLPVVLMVSALTIPLRVHALVAAVTLTGVAAVGAVGGGLQGIAFELVTAAAVATLAGLAASVLGRTLRLATTREHEAGAANAALMAVVDAARTATSMDADEVLEAVVTATQRLDGELAGAYLQREDGLLEYGATRNVPADLAEEVFDPDEGLAGMVLRENRMVLTNDYQEFAAGMDVYRALGLRSAMGAPIRVEDKAIGVLVVGKFSPGGFEPAAVTAFELLADHAGRALTLSRAIDEDRRLLERLKSLRALQEDFVATVSHELRTPLTVIDGLAETLTTRHDALDDEQLEQMLSRLRANTTNLKTIVTSLLEAARFDRGLVELEEQIVPVWDLVEACVARLAPVLATHDVRLDLEDALVLGDRDLLERVVDNLLTNAQRHTPPSTRVDVQSRSRGAICTVRISDNGPGIAREDLARITDRFTRGGELHTRSTRGLGLGLALADQVLRLHGSRLEVASRPGEGSVFSFRLKIAE